MTMRQRSTWAQPGETPRQAATQRQADIYTMNQEHPQPSAIEYENGDPDTWAETPVPGDKMTVKDEYEGDHVKRNEVGYGEFRDDTWKHKDSDQWNGKGKYDNAKVSAERKAIAAERVAKALLRTANESLIEEQTVDLMAMPSPILVATLRRLDAAKPEAGLSDKQKLTRGLACAKLATKTLGDAASANAVVALGKLYAGLDDQTLKSMLKVVATAAAAARVAQQQDEEEGGHTSQQEQPVVAQPVVAQPVVAQGDEGGEEEEEEEETVAQDEEPEEDDGMQAQEESVYQQETVTHGLCPADAAMLDQILNEEMAPAVPAPAVPPGADELQALFMPAPVAPAGGPPMMAAQASPMPDISFDDEEAMSEPVHATVASAAGLDDLFSDHPEVQAQREIVAAHRDQAAREGGYAPTASVRTASVGAKKLGRVQAGKPASVEDQLSVLWRG